jgi:hypothetical protein
MSDSYKNSKRRTLDIKVLPEGKKPSDEPQRVKLTNGSNVIGFVFIGKDVVPEEAILNLDLFFNWSDHAVGSRGHLTILHNSLTIATCSVSAFGVTSIPLCVRGVRDKIVLQVILEVKNISEALLFNSSTFDFQMGELEAGSITIIENPIGQREYIARFAMTVAESIGLRGQYMTGPRKNVFVERIEAALERQLPYSVVRVGDGEGRVIGYPLYFSQNEILSQLLYYHFGPKSIHEFRDIYGRNWIDELMKRLRELLVNSLISADVIGIPVYDFFRDIDGGVTSGMVGYGCGTHYILGRCPHVDANLAVGTNVFQQLAELPDFFPRLAKRAHAVFSVGAWDLSADLSKAFGVPSVVHVEVPRHFTWSAEKGAGQFPLLYSIVEQRLRAMGDLRGQLFLVGAGLLGKHYCAVVKEQGGVALDIGSVFDSWAQKGLPYAVRNGERIKLNNLNPNS